MKLSRAEAFCDCKIAILSSRTFERISLIGSITSYWVRRNHARGPQESSWNKACNLSRSRYKCQFHSIHKYCNEISAVYSVCSTCHHCVGSIRVLITGMWKCIGWDSFTCCFRFWSYFFRFFGFGWFFSTVLRFLIGPNAPLNDWLIVAVPLTERMTELMTDWWSDSLPNGLSNW